MRSTQAPGPYGSCSTRAAAGGAQEGAADAASSVLVAFGHAAFVAGWQAAALRQLTCTPFAVVSLLILISLLFLFPGCWEGGVFLQLELLGRRWWPQLLFGGRAVPVCWGPASGGDAMSCPASTA